MLATATVAAKSAGAVLRDHFGGVRQVAFKGTIDLVTEMDRRSEQIVVEHIRQAFPDHGILAEEGARIDSASGYLWVIDPLDGTTNYAHGYPQFAVSIGLEHAGEIVLGVVYDPLREELFSALRGEGAFLNGRKIAVSPTATLIRSLLATGFPYDRAVSAVNNLNCFNAMIMACQEIRRNGSAALDLCNLAAGRLDGYWEQKLRPWDVAAGSLIVREAGGAVTDLAGAPYAIRGDFLVASNGAVHEQMLAVLRGAEEAAPRP